MALPCPNQVHMEDLHFQQHSRIAIFNAPSALRSNVDLLAVASNHGLLFAGDPNRSELKVVMLKQLVEAKQRDEKLLVRVVSLSSVANAIACSADGSMLAVNYTLNGSGFLQIYSVPSFLTPNIKSLYNIRISPEENVFTSQLLWNPALTAMIAVVLSNGSLGLYVLKENGQYEFRSLDKSQQVECGCWSPKGKQIVLGFPNGKLQQFKPDLTPAKTIACPDGLHPGPFDTIALQWLSTFQFAVAFLQRGDNTYPSIYIVNTPKGAGPSYINYNDVCFCSSILREHQIKFIHIQQWNMLLVTSANSTDVVILCTKEGGEKPVWVRCDLLDASRIEMPLYNSEDETFPIGLAFDTASVHQLIVDDKQIPIMPMVHVLSTHGDLISYNFLNLSADAVSVCSPPPPITDTSGQFAALKEAENTDTAGVSEEVQEQSSRPPMPDTSFSFAATSTPALKDKSNAFGFMSAAANSNTFPQNVNKAAPTAINFGYPAAPKSNIESSGPFSTTTTMASTTTTASTPMANTFGGFNSMTAGNQSLSWTGFGPKPTNNVPKALNVTEQKQTTLSKNSAQSSDLYKPLHTVPPTFVSEHNLKDTPESGSSLASTRTVNSEEMDAILQQLACVQITSFSKELECLTGNSLKLSQEIGNVEQLKGYAKRLNSLQELCAQANDREFEMEVKNLRHVVLDSCAILAECQSRIDMYNNPDLMRVVKTSNFDPLSRELKVLQSYVSTNQVLLQQVQTQLDEQRANYQHLQHRGRGRMHMPFLENVYQRMLKLKDAVAESRKQINHIRAVLKEKGYILHPLTSINAALTDTDSSTAHSLTLLQSDGHQTKLPADKMDAIRDYINHQTEIRVVMPQRPARKGLDTNVVLQTMLKSQRAQLTAAALTTTAATTMSAAAPVLVAAGQMPPTAASSIMETASLTAASLAKPTPTKPAVAPTQTHTAFSAPVPTGFNFGNTSPFVKTALGTLPVSEEAVKPVAAKSDFTAKPFGQSLNLSQPKTVENLKTGVPTAMAEKTTPATTNTVTLSASSVVNSHATSAVVQPTTIVPNKQIFAFESDSKKADGNTANAAKPFTFSAGTDSSASTLKDFSTFSTSGAKPFSFDPRSSNQFSGFGGFGAQLGTAAPNASTSLTQMSLNKSGFAVSAPGGIAASANSAVSSASFAATATATTTATKPAVFSGFGQSIGGAPSLSLEGFSLSPSTTASTAAMSVPTTSTDAARTMKAATPAITTATSAATSLPASTSTEPPNYATAPQEAAESFFAGLNICKPSASSESGTPKAIPTNLFASLGDTGSSKFSFVGSSSANAKPLFGSITIEPVPAETTKTATTSTSSAETAKLSSTSLPTDTSSNIVTSPSTSTVGSESSVSGVASTLTLTATSTSSISQTSASVSFAPVTTTTTAAAPLAPVFGVAAPTPASTSSSFAVSTTAATPTQSTGLFSSVPKPASVPTSPFGSTGFTTQTPAATSPGGSVFAGGVSPGPGMASGGNIFGGTAPATTSSGGFFGNAPAAAATSAGNFFGGNAMSTTSAGNVFSGGVAAASGGNLFSGGGGPAPTSPGNLFSGGAANTSGGNLFSGGTAPTSGGSIFGGNTSAVSGGNLFGGNASGFGNTSTSPGGSIFGGAATAGASAFGASSPTSTFGGFGPAANNTESTNVFGGTPKPVQSIFGGGNTTTPQSPPSNAAPFGASPFAASSPTSGGSIFGGNKSGFGNTSPAVSGGSLFGGTAAGPAFGNSPNSSGFGGFSQSTAPAGFGATSPSGFFAQGGASVAQTGFGSSPQPSAFSKPVFGGSPGFGSPPAFGTQPSFGGAATFGSPKGFGTFSSNTGSPPANTFGGSTQKNNLFETLGSTETGLSFGNLAQTTTTNAQKPTFGGSSFMNYRS